MTQESSSPLSPEAEVLAPEDRPKVDHLITEDDTPVDSISHERQQRLLVESLYSSWAGPGEGRPFLAMSNVGLFYSVHQPPFVPNVMLSLDVRAPQDIHAKSHRSYFIWEYGKPPDVVIEIISHRKGAETESWLRDYAQIGIDYYVIFDPTDQLGAGVLRVYGLHEGVYRLSDETMLPTVGLGLTLWTGAYQGMKGMWLRWCDLDGRLILTGAECADQMRQRAEQARQRANEP